MNVFGAIACVIDPEIWSGTAQEARLRRSWVDEV
jgi:hypothetical protein